MKWLLIFFFASNLWAQKIYILKQWHLEPKVTTNDIATATKLPQADNQLDLYQKSLDLIKNQKVSVSFSEGCEETEINEKFLKKYNGWDYAELDKFKDKEDYEKILTLLPLKIEVKEKEKIKSWCADNEKLIHDSQLALSDVRAFTGFLLRLKELKAKKDQAGFDRYAKSLLENKKKDPIEYARSEALKAITQFEKLNLKREEHFIKTIVKKKLLKDQAAILIIGGVHAASIESQLKANKLEVEIVTPKGYVETDVGLLEKLKEQIKE